MVSMRLFVGQPKIQKLDGSLQKPCCHRIFFVTVEIVHIVGRDETLCPKTAAQLQKFRVGNVSISGAVGAEEGAGQFLAGT